MALSRGVARTIILIGTIQVALTVVAITFGTVTLSKMTKPDGVDIAINIWAVYFAIPGFTCIAAGLKKSPSMMGVSIGTNIFGCLVDIGQFIVREYVREIVSSTWLSAENILDVLLAIVSFGGSIFGCIGDCICSCGEEGVVIDNLPPIELDMVMTDETKSYKPPRHRERKKPPRKGYPATMPQQQVQYPGGVSRQTQSGTSNVAYSGEDVTIKSTIP